MWKVFINNKGTLLYLVGITIFSSVMCDGDME